MSKPSLEDYVKAHPTKRGPGCSVCNLPAPILAKVNSTLKTRAVPQATIAGWLVALGYKTMNRAKVAHHLSNHVH